MADRALRGMQIGAKSLESEDGVVSPTVHRPVRVPERTRVRGDALQRGHGARDLGMQVRPDRRAHRRNRRDEDNKPVKPQRTHWDMLLERRSIEELEIVLSEQLTAYREGRLRPEAPTARANPCETPNARPGPDGSGRLL